MDKVQKKREKALQKELRSVEKQEQKLQKAFVKAKQPGWKTAVGDKIPQKVFTGLESAFSKGFSLVFNQGRSLIEKSYNKENLKNNHSIRDYAVQLKGSRKELKAVHKSARRADGLNMVVTTAEGLALGALGIGLPDIVLFITTLLKGVYESALNYGFEYDTPEEQYMILNMMSASLITGLERVEWDEMIDGMIAEPPEEVSREILEEQIRETASVFAMDMLILKFIQGFPVVGILGGIANPIYYNRVLRYVQLKYRKRYLLKQTGSLGMKEMKEESL
jgi:hypothetical protein